MPRLGALSKDEGLQLITDAYPPLVDQFAATSADLTAQWYAELAPTKTFVPEPASLPTTDQLAASGRWAVLQDDPAGALQGSATRTVFDSSRRTVRDNAERENVRWTRYASANACGFCRMLATRALTVGPGSPGLYRTKASAESNAHTADIRGHDHCKCIAVPVRNGNYQPPAYVHDWTADYSAVSRDADGNLRPQWQIADLMEKKGAERLGIKPNPVGRPKDDEATKAAKAAKAAKPEPPRRDTGGRFAGTSHLIDRNNEQAAAIGKSATDRVQVVKEYIDRADNVVSTAATITGRIKVVTDLADKAIGGAVPIVRDVKTVVDAAHKATTSASKVTGGAANIADLATKTITDTVRIAHGTKQIADEIGGVLDDVTFVAAGIRQILVDTGNAARNTAADARSVSSVSDLVAKMSTAVDTAGGIRADGAAIVDHAKSAVDAVQGIVQGVQDFPARLRAPFEDAQRFVQNVQNMAGQAGQTVDDALAAARSMKALLDAVVEYRRGTAEAAGSFDDTRNVVRVQSERADVTPQQALTADERQQQAILPGTEPLALPAAPQRALERGTGGFEPVDESLMKALEGPDATVVDSVTEEVIADPMGRDDALVAAVPPGPEGDELDRLLNEASAATEAGDFDRADELFGQIETLEKAREAKAAKAARDRASRQARRAAADEVKRDRVLALIDDGTDAAEAESEVYGVPVEKIRRRDFMAQARADGHVGNSFEKLLDSVFIEKAAEQFWAAEEATNGYMLKRKYAATVQSKSLWFISDKKAREYMSDEMAAWFDQHGRITKPLLREAVLEGRGAWRDAMTEDFLQ